MKDDALATSIKDTPVAMVLSDPTQDDNPLVFVNEAFEQLTLYARDAALGRNCRFLQCDETDPEAVAALRAAIAAEREVSVDLINERADGTRFLNRLVIAPLRGEDGKVNAFLGIQSPIEGTAEDQASDIDPDHRVMLRELQHRVKNHLAMVVSMIRLQASRDITRDSFEAVGRRVEALALLYDEMFDATVSAGGAHDRIRARAYLSRIARTVSQLTDTAAIRLNTDCDEIDLPIDQAARLGLLLSELLTNALEHAFAGREKGMISIRFRRLSNDMGVRLVVEDDGVGLPDGNDWPFEAPSVQQQTERARTEAGELDTRGHDGRSGVGGSIVRSLTQMLGATLDVGRTGHGTTITVDFEPEA
jgi:PAS domain S-box-containing protein